MTIYGIDGDRGLLIAMWQAGLGGVAQTVATLPAGVAAEHGADLTEALSTLSATLWESYVRADAVPGAGTIIDDAHLDRGDALSDWIAAVVQHRTGTAADVPIAFYDPIDDAAHRIATALDLVGNADLDGAVLAEVRREVASVEAAARGDLSGRARQAVTLSRLDVSPVQVVAADQALHREPLGSEELFTTLDPTAAAVAAAHWLEAAVSVVADISGIPTTAVLDAADNIEALPHTAATTVLEMMSLRCTPRDAVIDLVEQATAIADGEAVDLYGARDAIVEAIRLAEADDSNPYNLEQVDRVRLTPLAPHRPASDLLEQFVAGIRGCWTVYAEYINREAAHAEGLEATRGSPTQQEFLDAVRIRAADNAERLGA
ncbi:hypothetical protein Drose_17110 [Dactylosporangium roseum]|uniref:DUF222 domain-containing protein n=1 Tax=Dactylosporangium roseum TaxID=47989 RepID=A0ABY5ZCD7_9ACTN|nr:hypothetical protein [Dactylosporangium roseum]UWZ39786.1 hypothetical protein Drose_17110 [Dactylosporangium roseum]